VVGRQNRLGHHTLRAPPSRPKLKLPVALLEEHLDPHNRVPLAGRHRLGQSQQRRLRGLVGHVYDDASIRAEEGRGEVQRVRDMLFRRRRRRRHSGDDDARRRTLHGRHVERVEQLDVRVRDRMDEFFRAPPSAVEQVDPTRAESVKRVDRRTRGASCADDEAVLDLVRGRWQASLDDVPDPHPVRVVAQQTPMATCIRERDHGVYGSDGLGFGSELVELRHDVALQRNRDGCTAEIGVRKGSAYVRVNLIGFEAPVGVREAQMVEGGVVQRRGHGMRDWLSKDVELLCRELANQV